METPVEIPESDTAGPSKVEAAAKESGPQKFFRLGRLAAKHWIFIFGVFMTAASTALLIVAVNSHPSPGGVCRNISESSRTGVNLDVAPDPIAINNCGVGACEDETKRCSNQCPFGFDLDEQGCAISCECKKSGSFQGDIQFESHEIPTVLQMFDNNAAIAVDTLNAFEVHQIWDQNKNNERYRVPIQFDESIGPGIKQLVRGALSEISGETCLDFVDATFEAQHIVIKNASTCSASFGRNPDKNVVNIKALCSGGPAVQHLFMHALGFHHEQSRPDRDLYVTINTENIRPGYEGAFTKLDEMEALDLEVPYNPKSVMHFAYNAFSKEDSLATITGKAGAAVRGENPDDLFTGVQDTDLLLINRRYRCSGHELNATWTEWGSWAKDHEKDVCTRSRRCLNSRARNSVGCEGESIEVDPTEVGCRSRLVTARFAPGMFGASNYLSDYTCMNGQILTGKFNEDRRDDILCVYPDGWIRLFLASYNGEYKRLSWEGQTRFCQFVEPPGQRLVGDLNGDGYDDLLCRKKDGTVEITLYTDEFFLNRLDWYGKIPSCVNDDVATLEDLNGDGMAEFVCGDKDVNRFREVYLNVYKPQY